MIYYILLFVVKRMEILPVKIGKLGKDLQSWHR